MEFWTHVVEASDVQNGLGGLKLVYILFHLIKLPCLLVMGVGKSKADASCHSMTPSTVWLDQYVDREISVL